MAKLNGAFAILWGRVCSMLNDSGVSDNLRSKFWAEGVFTATKLCTITSKRGINSTYEGFYGKPSKMEQNLRIFGEIGVKVARAQVHLIEKLANKDSECLFIG